MLVLARTVGQKIFIGDDITVTFLEHRRGGAIRVGIDAPKDVQILRDDAKPKPESLTDFLPELDVRLGMAAEQQYLEDKHGGAERPDDIGRETNPRDRPW